MTISQILNDIRNAIKNLEQEQKGTITNFKKQNQEGQKLKLKGAIQQLLNETKNTEAQTIAQKIAIAKMEEIPAYLEKIAEIIVDIPQQRTIKAPLDIRDEINADMKETQKCLETGCYRSAVILCGRMMETALHRKYYDATGVDLLEKAPGTGLGNLIAKLAEKGVKLDPGLTNQIHLINQVRVYSVHTKKQTFVPTKIQAQAIMLYTTDILEKLFNS